MTATTAVATLKRLETEQMMRDVHGTAVEVQRVEEQVSMDQM